VATNNENRACLSGRRSLQEVYLHGMRLLHEVSEDEVIATFLRAELDSSRYGDKLRAALARDGRAPDILRRPDLADPGRERLGLVASHLS
jgi:hypothetical protein